MNVGASRVLVGACAWLAVAWFSLASVSVGAGAGDGIDFFEREIRPLLDGHCLECHSAATKHKGGLLLDSRAGWTAGGDSGGVIVPGDPAKSRILEAVRYQNRDLQMPPDNPLSRSQVAALEKWITIGAPDPRESAPRPVALHGLSEAQGRAFWSFRPVADPPILAVADSAWVQTPVDTFILAGLEKAGLNPAPPATSEALLRRVTFDLTGLPPDPADLDAFLADPSPDAWERAVDRLLDSPHYGVRWGRHWLDVARYADSNGLDENLGFGQAWRYRDYVIDSFNSDKPFDRFLLEQLAGDLLPGANAETKIATGFLALGARVLAEPDEEKLRMDVIDEQLDTLGKAFLGLTLGCARCHDHKFDPVTQRDYYGLAAIFKSSESFASSKTGVIKHWYEHSLATAEELARAKADDDRITAKRAEATKFKTEAVARVRTGARERTVEYLVAAARLDRAATLTQAEEIAAPLGLQPWILHHCRLHLEYHADDPLFAPWQALAGAGDGEGIRRHYRGLADAKDPAWTAALDDNEGLLAVPSEPAKAFDAATVKELDRLEEVVRLLESEAYDAPSAMGVAEASKIVAELPIHIRGSHINLGEVVPRAVPAVMRGESGEPPWQADQSGRLALAAWMVHPDHPLTARVIVNRVWRWHFGTGLVATPDNFGVKGQAPSHPELLDWLARRFVESGWDIKELHRLLLQSAVYRMGTVHPRAAQAALIDPENRLHWRFERRRLEAEAIRDAVLDVSGTLDLTMGGKTLPLRNRQMVFNHTSKDHTTYGERRRSAYLPIVRNHVADVLAQFDYPDPTMPTGSRNSTVVAPQSLFLLNSPLVLDAADAMASAATGTPEERVDWIYRRALSRLPSKMERMEAVEWIQDCGDSRSWSLFCQAVMASNEFVYLP